MPADDSPPLRLLLRLLGPVPARLNGAVLVDAVGTGLYLSSAALFLTVGVGLTPGQLALGLSAAAILGLFVTFPLGLLADRVSLTRLLTVTALTRAAGFACFALVEGFVQFFVVALMLGAVEKAMPPLVQSLVIDHVPTNQRVTALAHVRVLRNSGFVLGALLATIPLALGSRAALNGIVLGNALSFVLFALLLPRTGRRKLAKLDGPKPRAALRDGRYVALTVLHGLLMVHLPMLTLLLPLWVDRATAAPRAVIPVLFAINALLVVLLQVRAARLATAPRRSTSLLMLSGGAFAVSALLFAAAAEVPMRLAVMLLLIATLTLTAGELLLSSGGWQLSVDWAPERARASYLSLFSLGTAAQALVGPALLVGVVLRRGGPGWFGLAIVFVLAGLLARTLPRGQEGERLSPVAGHAAP